MMGRQANSIDYRRCCSQNMKQKDASGDLATSMLTFYASPAIFVLTTITPLEPRMPQRDVSDGLL